MIHVRDHAGFWTVKQSEKSWGIHCKNGLNVNVKGERGNESTSDNEMFQVIL